MSSRIAYAKVGNTLISPEKYKTTDGLPICPGCDSILRFMKVKDKVPFFSHTSRSGCTQRVVNEGIDVIRMLNSKRNESQSHKNEKARIMKVKPDFITECSSCGAETEIPLKKDVRWYTEERSGPFVVDVMAGNLAIEVVNTHHCTERKIKFFNSNKIPWIEVTDDGSETILNSSSFHCRSCQKALFEKQMKEFFKKEQETRSKIENSFLIVLQNI